MNASTEVEEIIVSGKKNFVDSTSPTNSFATFFEDEGDTGYFYAVGLGISFERCGLLLLFHNSQNRFTNQSFTEAPNVRFFAGFTSSLAFRYSVTLMVRLRKFNSTPPFFGLSSFL